MLMTRRGLGRSGVVLALGVAVVGVAWFAQASVSRRGREGKTVAPATERPFVIEFRRTEYRTDPKGRPGAGHFLQRRADGAYISGPVRGGLRPLVVGLPDGREMRVNEQARARVTMPARRGLAERLERRREIARKRAAKGKALYCGEMFEFPVGSAVVAGVETTIFERESLGPRGDIVRTREYRAPSLGCVALRKVGEERTESGSFRKRWEDVAQSVREPAPADLTRGSLVSSYHEIPSLEFSRLGGCSAGLDKAPPGNALDAKRP